MNLFFYPDNSEIRETWISISNFKYFQIVRIKNKFVWQFFFRDLMTFSFFTEPIKDTTNISVQTYYLALTWRLLRFRIQTTYLSLHLSVPCKFEAYQVQVIDLGTQTSQTAWMLCKFHQQLIEKMMIWVYLAAYLKTF